MSDQKKSGVSAEMGSYAVEEATTTGTSSNSQNTAVHGFRLPLLVIALCLAAFIMGLDLTVLATAIPTITNQFDAIQDVSWFGSSYFIVIAACNPLAGKVFQSYSPKWAYLVYIVIFMIGSLVSAVAPSSGAVIGGRVIMGIGASGMLGGILAIIGLFISKKDQPSYFGLIQGLYIIAEALGPLVGGAFTQFVTWRWCFYLSLPFGGVCGVLFFIVVPNKYQQDNNAEEQRTTLFKQILRVDMPGFVLFAGAIVMLLLALQFGGGVYAWSSSEVIGLFVGFGVMIVTFAAWQLHKQDQALIPPRILTNRTVISSFLVALFGNGAFQTLVYYMPIWFQTAKAANAFESGIMYLPTAISDLVTAVIGGILISKLPYYNPFLIAGAALFVIGAGLYTTLDPATSEGKWIGYQILVGVGFAFIVQVPVISVQRVLPTSEVAIGSTTIVFAQSLSGAVFLAVAEAVFGSQLRKALAQTSLSSTLVEQILASGTNGYRSFVPSDDIGIVEDAFNYAVTRVFWIPVACGLACWICSWGLEWVKVDSADESNVKEGQGPHVASEDKD